MAVLTVRAPSADASGMFGSRLSGRAAAVCLAVAVVAATFGGAGAPYGSGGRVDVLVWGASTPAAAAAVRDAGATITAELPLVGGVATSLTGRERAEVEAAGFLVSEDEQLSVSGLDTEAVPAADVQLATVNPGNDWDLTSGSGVGVALIDTGVTEVPDLEGRVVQGPDLSGEGSTDDTHGHGTFMAGLIAGDGTLSSSGATRHVGVAPGAHIVSVKVAGADGASSLSRLLDAIGWVVANADRHAIRVLNLSVAVPPLSRSYLADPLSAAVEAAWSSGITVVAASGNDGTKVSSPGRDPWIITVGAVDTGGTATPEDDAVPAWSGRATSPFGAKPELLAPGVSTLSLLAPRSALAASDVTVIDGHYLRGSGTSMATAMTSGAVAVLTEHHAAATPDDYKGALVNTARPLTGEVGGLIDLAAADLVTVDAGGSWWQVRPVAFDGLGAGLSDRMPWAEEWAGSRWAGSRWAGTRWAGSRWAEQEWTGSRWATAETVGSRWAGSRWAGSRWAGSRWAGSRWAGSRWAGSRWADELWAGTRWAGSHWAGSRWAESQWAGSRWAGSRWADSQWAGSRWAGSTWAADLFTSVSAGTEGR